MCLTRESDSLSRTHSLFYIHIQPGWFSHYLGTIALGTSFIIRNALTRAIAITASCHWLWKHSWCYLLHANLLAGSFTWLALLGTIWWLRTRSYAKISWWDVKITMRSLLTLFYPDILKLRHFVNMSIPLQVGQTIFRLKSIRIVLPWNKSSSSTLTECATSGVRMARCLLRRPSPNGPKPSPNGPNPPNPPNTLAKNSSGDIPPNGEPPCASAFTAGYHWMIMSCGLERNVRCGDERTFFTKLIV